MLIPSRLALQVTAPISSVGETPKTFTKTITVKRPAVTSVKLETGLTNNTITLGDATEKGIAIKATVSPEFSNPEITWASNNTKVATVDNAGNVKFTGEPGFVAITATSTHGNGGAKVVGTASINVVRPAVTAISVYDAADKDKKPITDLKFTFGENKTVDLNVAATPKYASNDVYWITGNAGVASVDAATGVVKQGSEIGTTTLTAVSTANGKIQARVNVTVARPAATKLTVVLPKGVDTNKVETGTTFKLGTKAEPAAAAPEITWSSSDPTVATVSNDGTVTTLKAGKTTITATVKNADGTVATAGTNAVSGSTDITVVESATDLLKTYKATYTDKDGNTVEVPNFNASKNGEFKLPAGTDLSTLKVVDKDGKAVEVKTAYTDKNGKAVDNAKDATAATVAITSGKTTTTQKFTLDAATKTWTVIVKDNNGAGDSTYKINDGDSLKLVSAPVWTGHDFLGYYTTPDFQDGTQFKFKETPVTSDLTLYAKWSDTGTNSDKGSNTAAFTADELTALKNVKADYTVDGKDVPVEGFDPTQDGSYTIDGDINTLRVFNFPDSWDASIVYSANGKEADADKADAAVVTLKAPSGASVRYSFTEKPGTNPGADDTKANPVTTDQKAANNAGNADSSKTPAKTGAAVGIILAIGAAMAGIGATIKRKLSH